MLLVEKPEMVQVHFTLDPKGKREQRGSNTWKNLHGSKYMWGMMTQTPNTHDATP